MKKTARQIKTPAAARFNPFWSFRLALILYLTFPGLLFAQQYQVEGDLDYQVFDENGTQMVHMQRTFAISIKDCLWQIKSSPSPVTELDVVSVYESSTDGTNVYATSTFNPKYDRAKGGADLIKRLKIDTNALVAGAKSPQDKKFYSTLTAPGPAKTKNNAVGKIFPGTLPRFSSDFGGILWLAYGSSCFFAHNPSNTLPRMTPFENPRQAVDDYLVGGIWQLSGDAPHLPMRADCLSKGTHYALQEKQTFKIMPYPAPFDQGFTNGVFEVLAQTNTQGMTFPLTFKMSHLVPIPNGTGAPELKTTSIIEGHTKRIQFAALVASQPAAPADTVIQDLRGKASGAASALSGPVIVSSVKNPTALQYLVRAKEKLGGTNVQELTKVDREMRDAGKKKQDKIKLVSVVVLVLISLGFMITAWAVINRKRRQE